MKKNNPREISPVEVFFNLVGGKYKGAIVWYLHEYGTMRYNELIRCLPSPNPKTLTHQLREMEANGIVIRKVYPEVPPRVEYCLTDLGNSIFPVIQETHLWAVRYVNTLPEKDAPITDKMRKCYLFDDQDNYKIDTEMPGPDFKKN